MKKIAVTNLLAEGIQLEGIFKSQSSIRIDGYFKGDLIVSSPHGIIVGPKGIIVGTVTAGGLVVLGKVVGQINVEHLEIRKGGLVEGTIKYDDLEIFSGGKLVGTSSTEVSESQQTDSKVLSN